MSKGIGNRQREILEQLTDGEWHEVAKLSHPDAVLLAGNMPHYGGSRPWVVQGSHLPVTGTGRHKSTLRALRSLEQRGLVEMRRADQGGTGRPYEARIVANMVVVARALS
jgi:hypothetical protein